MKRSALALLALAALAAAASPVSQEERLEEWEFAQFAASMVQKVFVYAIPLEVAVFVLAYWKRAHLGVAGLAVLFNFVPFVFSWLVFGVLLSRSGEWGITPDYFALVIVSTQAFAAVSETYMFGAFYPEEGWRHAAKVSLVANTFTLAIGLVAAYS
jgi:hypothetical protein